MSLYAEYAKERLGRETFETEFAFATYCFPSADECYIVDLYIRPEFRRTGVGTDFGHAIAEIARSRGCKYLSGSVVPSANGSTESVKALLSFGYKIAKSEVNLIWFYKEL